jgi:[ribosomal protein S5]-alanine N-acetyltransferase
MDLRVNEQIRLTEIRPTDKPAFVEHLATKDVYNWTLRIPHPYTEADADTWLSIVAESTQKYGRPVYWAIRDSENRLIGSCGIEAGAIDRWRRAEIGYWLAKPYWGRGIMTDVVRVACEHAFREFDLIKIWAAVFSDNAASARVLEKCGFQLEGLLKRHYVKDGRPIDARFYGLLR